MFLKLVTFVEQITDRSWVKSLYSQNSEIRSWNHVFNDQIELTEKFISNNGFP